MKKTCLIILLLILIIINCNSIGIDKKKHFWVGFGSYPIFQNFNYQTCKMDKSLSFMFGFVEVGTLACAKEGFDCIKTNPTGFDISDIGHTLKGSIYSILPTLLFDYLVFPSKYAITEEDKLENRKRYIQRRGF